MHSGVVGRHENVKSETVGLWNVIGVPLRLAEESLTLRVLPGAI